MSRSIWFSNRLVFLLCLATPLALSQTQGQEQGSNTASQSEDVMMVPSPLSVVGSTLAFTSELARANYLDGGVSIGTTFDDNALNTSGGKQSDLAYQFMPYISLSQTLPRLRWTLNYASGATINERLTSRDQLSQNLGFEGHYRISPHVDLTVTDHFFVTNNFYNPLNQDLEASQPGLLQSPNQTLITPLATETGNTGTAQLNYQFSRNNSIGASGGLSQTRYTNAPADASLVDSHSKQGQAFFNHRLTPRNYLSASYAYARLTFAPLAQAIDVQSMFVTYTLVLQKTMSLSFFGGPQFSDLQTSLFSGIPFSIVEKNWSAAGGVTYSWNGKHTSVRADFSRRVNDGGGLTGPVEATSVDAVIRRQLTRSVTVGFMGLYALNGAIGGAGFSNNFSSATTASGSASIERSLGGSLSARLGYERDYQSYSYGLAPNNINHNRGWITISYHFARPLGR